MGCERTRWQETSCPLAPDLDYQPPAPNAQIHNDPNTAQRASRRSRDFWTSLLPSLGKPLAGSVSKFHSDVTGTHTIWECVYRLGMQQTCDITCLCMCHGNKFPLMLKGRGHHLHEWAGRVYHLEGQPDNMAIWCKECPMTVAAGSKPGVISN